MDDRAKQLIKQADKLFERKMPVNSLHQEIAENFYPERADFTAFRGLGEDFASNLLTSYPVIARRDLGNAFNGMLRPNNKDWFKVSVGREDRIDVSGQAWLEAKAKVMRRAMYDRVAQFVRATKEGDHDFAAFGQCAISTELSRDRSHMLYRCWHLRDMAWCENYEGRIDTIARKWKPTAQELIRLFGDRNHQKVKDKMAKDPYCQFHVYHMVVPSDVYDTASAEPGKDGNRKRKFITPYVSIYVDVDNKTVIEETGVWTTIYTIPRWQTVSGSQYAHSPATVAALPDARLIQSMTLVLLEAGEKATNPPMVATQDVVRSDISIYAGGVTWVDRDYDERLGSALRPIEQDYSGIPMGMDMRNDVKATIMEAFYLNKLNLPPVGGPEMTAYEAGQRVQEYIRNALPLFEPMEMDYNGSLCEHTFEIMLRAGAFGSVYDMPQSLRGQDVVFKFESPLHDAAERQKGHTLMEARQMLGMVMELDPGAANVVNARRALRDTLKGIQVPAEWMATEDEESAADKAMAQRQQTAMAMEAAQAGGKAAAETAKAAKAMESVH